MLNKVEIPVICDSANAVQIHFKSPNGPYSKGDQILLLTGEDIQQVKKLLARKGEEFSNATECFSHRIFQIVVSSLCIALALCSTLRLKPSDEKLELFIFYHVLEGRAVGHQRDKVAFKRARLWQCPFWLPDELCTIVSLIAEARLVAVLGPVSQLVLCDQICHLAVD